MRKPLRLYITQRFSRFVKSVLLVFVSVVSILVIVVFVSVLIVVLVVVLVLVFLAFAVSLIFISVVIHFYHPMLVCAFKRELFKKFYST